MALIKCPDCGTEVSASAKSCPKCGCPVADRAAAATTPAANVPLAEVRPSWWQYFWYLVFFWLLIPLLVAWWKRSSVRMRVYPDRIVLDRGLVSKCSRELFIRDIRSVDIDQGLLARLVKIGDLTISTAASADAVEQIAGIPDPKSIRDLIISRRQAT